MISNCRVVEAGVSAIKFRKIDIFTLLPRNGVNTDGFTGKNALEVTLDTCIREVLASNLGRDTDYPD